LLSELRSEIFVNMKFFKPTPTKVIIAVILTVWPYVASFVYVNMLGEGDVFSDNMVRSSFVYHAWEWSPLYLIVQLISGSLLNKLWQSEAFIFIIYPLLRFITRYLVVCVLVFLVSKLPRRHIEVK
jgi:hypothetical protein